MAALFAARFVNADNPDRFEFSFRQSARHHALERGHNRLPVETEAARGYRLL